MSVRWVFATVLLCAVAACAGPDSSDVVSPGSSSLSPSPSPSVDDDAPTPPLGWDGVFRQVEPGVVRISITTCEEGGATGSGFVTSESVVVTAAHVVLGARAVTVQTSDGTTVAAEPVGIVADSDTAVLRLATSLDVQPLRFAESVPDRGSELAVLGYPLHTFDLRITRGIVAGVPESVDYGDQYVDRAFITDAATNRGNSGGPVVDATGEVIGLVSGGQAWDGDLPVEGVNFIVPVDDVRGVVEEWQGETTSVAELCEGEEPGFSNEDLSWDWLELDVQDDSDLANAVGQVLFTHGRAINQGAFAAAFELFTPTGQARLGGLEEWASGVTESYWREVTVLDTSVAADESHVTARVTLRTEQLPDGDVTDCSLWDLEYQLALVDGQLSIEKARGERPTPC